MMKTIMLDVDGVLISGRPADGTHWTSSLEADLGISPADLKTHFFAKYWAAIQLGQVELMPSLADALQNMGCDVTAQQLADYWFSHDSRIDQSVLQACQKLRADGHAIWLATNQDHERAAYIMSDLGLSAHVDGIIYSAALGVKKPDPAFFKAAERAVSVDAAEIIFIDDTMLNVEAARACGWQAIHWNDENRSADLFDVIKAN
ncbi:HAD-IA family hydrolase [Brucella sp. 21LCYQ03]|nr:HAD-IA family hydrolase [Brucella sp. 21LCYQ03]